MSNPTPANANEKMAAPGMERATIEREPTAAATAAGESSRTAPAATSPYSASIDFLRLVYPEGPWALASFPPVKGEAGGRFATFGPDEADAAVSWIVAQNEGRRWQVYYHVNPLRPGEPRKATKADISRVMYLHVDVDPRSGDPLDAERERIRGLLDSPPQDVPPPTFVIDSGNGRQALWRLATPVPLAPNEATRPEKEAAAAEVEQYTRWLELKFGADSTHDVSRLLRLPGTINWKNQKGRVPTPARLVTAQPKQVYDLAAFQRLPAVRTAGVSSGPLGSSRPTVKVSGSVKRLNSVMELPDTVKDKVKEIIVQGKDLDNPDRFPGRSECLLYCCCEMVRAGCDDDTIYSVITDPQFNISASILDKGSTTEKYALRQIERARDFAGTDGVSLINRNYFAVLEGKKITFYREEEDKTITAMNADAFAFSTAPIKVTVDTTDARGNKKPIEVEAVKLWRASERRRFYSRGFVLDPTHSHADDEYNLWKGFGVQPAPGDWSLLRRHIESVLAAGKPEHGDYIIKWAAWTFQHPATPPRVALVFRGDEGTGKGVFGRALVTAFGTHGQRVQNIGHVAGRFNAHMRHCCMFFADEVSLVSDDQEGNLKGMITEPTLPIEAKGVDVVHAENHLHVVMASNRDFIIPAGIGARRFAMFDVPPTHKGDGPYWDKLYGEIENGGIAAMLHDLLALPLGNWHPETERPDTAALEDQKLKSLPPLERFWFNCLQSGELPCGAEQEGGKVFLPSALFVDTVNAKLGVREEERITPNKLASLCEMFGFTKLKSRPRGWMIAPLAEARRGWNEKMKMRRSWDEDDWWQVTAPTGGPEMRKKKVSAF